MMPYVSTSDETAFGREFLEQVLLWVEHEYKPEDIFDDDELNEWAADNGWVEEA